MQSCYSLFLNQPLCFIIACAKQILDHSVPCLVSKNNALNLRYLKMFDKCIDYLKVVCFRYRDVSFMPFC